MRNCILMQILLLQQVFASQVVKIVLLTQGGQEEIVGWYNTAMDSLKSPLKYETLNLRVDHEDTDKSMISDAISQGGNATLIVDLCWYANEQAKGLSLGGGVPYVRIDVSISPFLDFLDRYLDYRNSTDVAVIFENPSYLDQSIYYWIDSTRLRLHMTESLDLVAARRLRNLKPIPNSFAIFAKTSNMGNIFKLALQETLVGLPDRWHLVFLDFSHALFDRSLLDDLPVSMLLPSPDVCCRLLLLDAPCTCPETTDAPRSFLAASLRALNDVLEDIDRDGLELTSRRFEELLNGTLGGLDVTDGPTLRPRLGGLVEVGGGVGVVARYEEGAVDVLENKTVSAVRAFYRIGITHALPWSFKVQDPTTGTWNWTGYCVDFAKKLAEMIDFDFEFVEPKSGTFGEKVNGVWDGVVGDLVSGETDLAVTALILTADKEEVIDFVAPYFEQIGITIVIRKPVRKTSLFKFMTVLKLEVWLSIVASLIVTGFMVWFLDKYSPYSARNNKKAYPYPCREFTLKESFWFALTSFTPQGGGEAPKALSGRTLVAAYWLFVVLMLATFTANLAAFLTVERMQAPVQSLEQLARQSRINYTVVKDSETHKYFINMKNAEDTLYRMWKELTLNASVDDTRYRVWDYPIKEQYGHILLAINDSNPVPSAEVGFQTVDEHVDADYAFIHDSSEIRYEISRNCNLTEVGEVFAEKPYAVAIQQGSHLHDEISKSILLLQKDRYFEILQGKWWNHSTKGNCPSTDDNEGITLESLGGVFIATLFGLALAMITLVGEVMYYKRKRKVNDVKTVMKKNLKFPQDSQVSIVSPKILETFPITIGTTFKPVNLKEKMLKEREELKLAHVRLYPRARNRITEYRD